MNARCIVRRHAQTNIDNGFEFAAGTSGEGGGVHTRSFGERDGVKDVGRIAAGRNGDGNVTEAAEGFDLARENASKTVVIGDSGNGGEICGKGESGKSWTIKSEPANEFRGDVLGIVALPPLPKSRTLLPRSKAWMERSGELGKTGKDLRATKEGTLHGDGGFDGVASTTFELRWASHGVSAGEHRMKSDQ